MKLSIGAIYDLYVAITKIQQDAENFKFSSAVWIKLTVNASILQPIAAGYELGRGRTLADLNKENRQRKLDRLSDAEMQIEFMEKDAIARAEERDLPLETLSMDDLSIQTNAKIGAYLVSLSLITPSFGKIAA